VSGQNGGQATDTKQIQAESVGLKVISCDFFRADDHSLELMELLLVKTPRQAAGHLCGTLRLVRRSYPSEGESQELWQPTSPKQSFWLRRPRATGLSGEEG